MDASYNLYVAGRASDNVFKVTSGGAITRILDATGDGAGNVLDAPLNVAVDTSGNVFVTGNASNNIFEITTSGTITQIMDSSGDGTNGPSRT